MSQKPPAFQFYAKDWRSSMTVKRMTREQRGIYVDMLAIAWDSEEPGTINLSEASLCRELGIFKRTLRRLLRDFPATWRREGGKLVQPKLHEQWLKYREISAKRSASAVQMHMQKGGSAFAVASASATAISTKSKPGPDGPPKRSQNGNGKHRKKIEARNARWDKEIELFREQTAGMRREEVDAAWFRFLAKNPDIAKYVALEGAKQ